MGRRRPCLLGEAAHLVVAGAINPNAPPCCHMWTRPAEWIVATEEDEMPKRADHDANVDKRLAIDPCPGVRQVDWDWPRADVLLVRHPDRGAVQVFDLTHEVAETAVVYDYTDRPVRLRLRGALSPPRDPPPLRSSPTIEAPLGSHLSSALRSFIDHVIVPALLDRMLAERSSSIHGGSPPVGPTA